MRNRCIIIKIYFLKGNYSFNFNYQNMSIENRDFDIIVWGASGFTGRLVAEYLFQKYNSRDLKWAIAGRDKSKLTSIRNSYLDSNIPILIADSFDYVSLNKITNRTKVVCSTVGPYSKYGTLIVKSCIESGTFL